MATAQFDIETRLQTTIPPQPKNINLHDDNVSNSMMDVADRYATNHRAIKAGSELFAEGEFSENLFVVLDGWLFLHRILEDGRRQILDFALPGTVLGYRDSADKPTTFCVEALSDAVVAVIPLRNVEYLFREDTKAALTLLNAANETLMGAFDALTDIGRRTACEAVAHFLLRMHYRIEARVGLEQDGMTDFPLHQEHIGDALGLTAVHVCRTLGKLRAEGLIEMGRGRLRIIDLNALAEKAGVYSFEDTEFRLAS